jgi:hypothetical protein
MYVLQCECIYLYVQNIISSYFAYVDDNSNKVQFTLTVFFNYPAPFFPLLPRIIAPVPYLPTNVVV